MESAVFLELKTVKKGLQVLRSWVWKVGEDIGSPSIAIPSGQVTPGDLFQNVGDMNGFKGRDIGDVLEVLGSDFLQEGRKRKCPFIGTDGDKEGRVTILADCIYRYQIKVLVLPEGLGK